MRLYGFQIDLLEPELQDPETVQLESLSSVTINDGSGKSTYGVKLGDGDDYATIVDNVGKDSYNVDGGKGSDALTRTDNFPDDKDKWKIKNFEVIL